VITSAALWAKLKRDTAGRVIGWHSLVDHSADVAAVFETLLLQPTIRRRLATAAGRSHLDEVTAPASALSPFFMTLARLIVDSEQGWTHKRRLSVTSTSWRGFFLAMAWRVV
jgi:hypothetical protein